MTIRLDAIFDFSYDQQTNRYRWISGPLRGSFASKEAVMSQSASQVSRNAATLSGLASKVSNGEITLKQFQEQAGDALRKIHVAQAALGKGGWEKMQPEDWLRVGRELKRQYYDGKADDGRRFGLKHLAADIRDGKMSEAMLRSRLEAFAESGKVAYWAAWKTENGGAYGIRRLGVTDNHCAFCLTQAAIGPRPIAEIPPPGCCPQCLTRCKCSIVISDRADSLLAGSGWIA